MLLVQQISVHECSIVSCFLPLSLTFILQKTRTFLGPDSQFSGCFVVVVLGNHVDHTVDNYAHASVLAVLQVHMRNFHGSLKLVCSGLEDLC